jgi:hypothetical protein
MYSAGVVFRGVVRQVPESRLRFNPFISIKISVDPQLIRIAWLSIRSYLSQVSVADARTARYSQSTSAGEA